MKKYSDKVNKIVYGGDYNPEQWPEEIWAEFAAEGNASADGGTSEAESGRDGRERGN